MDDFKRPRKGDMCILVLSDLDVKQTYRMGTGDDDPDWAVIGMKLKVKKASPNFPVFICTNKDGEEGIFWDVQLLRQP